MNHSLSSIPSEAPQPRRFIKSLTGIRAFFSIWIVLFHYSVSPMLKIPTLHRFFEKGHFATDFFLILSGFVVSYVYFNRMLEFRRYDYLKFLVKRFARLYPLHILTFLAMVLFYLALRITGSVPQDSSQYSAFQAVLNIFMLQAWVPGLKLGWNFVSWSTSAEWFAYLFVFVFVITHWRRMAWWSRVSLVFTLYLLNLSPLASAYLHLPDRLVRMSFCFLFGTCLFQLLPYFEAVRNRVWNLLIALSIALVVLLILDPFPVSLSFLIAPIWGILLLSLFHSRGASESIFANPLAMRLGNISFSTYLVHGVLAKLVFYSDSHFPKLHLISPFVLLPFFVLATLLISDRVHLWIEIPSRAWVLTWGTAVLEQFKQRSAPARLALRNRFQTNI